MDSAVWVVERPSSATAGEGGTEGNSSSSASALPALTPAVLLPRKRTHRRLVVVSKSWQSPLSRRPPRCFDGWQGMLTSSVAVNPSAEGAVSMSDIVVSCPLEAIGSEGGQSVTTINDAVAGGMDTTTYDIAPAGGKLPELELSARPMELCGVRGDVGGEWGRWDTLPALCPPLVLLGCQQRLPVMWTHLSPMPCHFSRGEVLLSTICDSLALSFHSRVFCPLRYCAIHHAASPPIISTDDAGYHEFPYQHVITALSTSERVCVHYTVVTDEWSTPWWCGIASQAIAASEGCRGGRGGGRA